MEEQKNDSTRSQDKTNTLGLSKSLTNAQKQENSSTYSDNNLTEPIADTPFYVRKYADTGYFVTLGRHRVTEEEPTKEAAIQRVIDKRWDLLLTCVSAAVENYIYTKEELKKIPQG